MSIRKNRIFYAFIIILSVLWIAGCKSSINTSVTNPDKDLLTVHYIDVGQADSILVQINGKNLLIDAGNTNDGNKVVDYLQSKGVNKLDYVIATHPHEDHIGGMSTVIKKIPIDEFYAPKKTTSTKTFENMVDALQSKKLKIIQAKSGISLNLGTDVTCEMLSPTLSSYDDINNYSVVLKITYKNKTFLFMGDAQKLVEKQLLSSGANLTCDVLKVGHHGSSTSSSEEFLRKANPQMAVISCGKDNDYGHPHKETLDVLKKMNITLYRTDTQGTIILQSDGNKITKFN